MRVRVLGSAAGGGFPQWNCGCDNCREVRAGAPGLAARTQESIAVSGDGASWFLINASPEIRAQIEAFPGLWPRQKRHSPIAGILLTNGDLDHCLGLLSLRESHPLVVHATAAMRDGFRQGNVLYRTLERFDGQVDWRALPLGEERALGDAATKLRVTAVPLVGNLPLHLKGLRTPSREDNVGFVIRDERTGQRLAYLPGVAGPSPELERICAEADVIFFDGTFWTSDELIAAGLGTRRAEDMSHWPISGRGGSLEFLGRLPARRRILIHINNTNPILRDDSEERAALAECGIEVAFDGLEVTL
ncbi:MAG TPA: pyrroloquinoline quinone biosynthesis protein PqqB [Polyangia bacterium]|nr:pyrroloquinoline quinone biosynthesis protein PqqB [Polyangia bacterium]